MSRFNFGNKSGGHRLENIQSNDLQQKLTYQQLLNLNHDLTKQNIQLKNIGTRLGQELRTLHTQFQTKPRDQSTELYHALGSHPVLHQYQNTLIPLLDAYEIKIQEFQHGFEQVHEEFFNLEKRFEQICAENEELRFKLTHKIRELLDVYRNGLNSEMQSDFGQIVLAQINQKQRCLVEENNKLERDFQRYKSENQKYKRQVTSLKSQIQSVKSKNRQSNLYTQKLQTQLEKLKDSSLEYQIKIKQIEGEKRKLQQANERAQSQNAHLNKEKQFFKNQLQELRKKVQRGNLIQTDQNFDKNLIQKLNTKIAFLQAQQTPNDLPKRHSKLQKDFDTLNREKNKLKQALQSAAMKQDSLNEMINDLKNEVSQLSIEKSSVELSEMKIKKSLQNLSEKYKNDTIKLKLANQRQLEELQQNLRQRIEMKEQKIMELEEQFQKIKMQRDKLEKQNIMGRNRSPRAKQSKDAERTIQKLRQKLNINEQIFKQQIQILENDLAYLKKENDAKKLQCMQKTDQLKQLKIMHYKLMKESDSLKVEKHQLVEDFKKVRNQYEGDLHSKERTFDDKIRQIRMAVDQSDRKRKSQRQRVQQAAKQYKRVLEDLKQTYEARIRQLQSQITPH